MDVSSSPTVTTADLSSYLRSVPDEPAWIDVRGVLLSGRCRIFGGGDPGRGFVVRSTDFPFAAVVGEPELEAVWKAAGGERARPDFHLHLPPGMTAPRVAEVASLLPHWRRETVILHRRTGGGPRAEAACGAVVSVLEEGEGALDPERLPAEVRREVALALSNRCPLSVAWVEARPVSFCYAAWQTESLWDVAVHTLAPWRRRGFAAAAFEVLRRRLEARALEPVWGAYAHNPASLALARRLGFSEAARYLALTPPLPEGRAEEGAP